MVRVILANHDCLTLTEKQATNPEFQRGLRMGQGRETPVIADEFTDAEWIGFWTGHGQHCNRSADEVRQALG